MLFCYVGDGFLGRLATTVEIVVDGVRATKGRVLDVLFRVERRIPLWRDVQFRLRIFR